MTHHTSTHSGISNSDIGDTTGRQSVLSLVHEGMEVYDVRDNHIGSVDFVHFGSANETQQELGVGPSTPSPADDPKMRDNTFIDNLAEVFDPIDMPDQLRQKLLLSGFIRLDSAGLFASDRFITPDQITGVSGDRVQLAVTRDQLIKRR